MPENAAYKYWVPTESAYKYLGLLSSTMRNLYILRAIKRNRFTCNTNKLQLYISVAQVWYVYHYWRRWIKNVTEELFIFSSASRTCCVVHPASYSIGTSGSFSWYKAAKAWKWPLTCPRPRLRGIIPPGHQMILWLAQRQLQFCVQ